MGRGWGRGGRRLGIAQRVMEDLTNLSSLMQASKKMKRFPRKMSPVDGDRVARFLLVQHTKTGKIWQITIKYTKLPQNMPNRCKIDKMLMKCTNIFLCKAPQNLPKL
jgi:hypothetical protein